MKRREGIRKERLFRLLHYVLRGVEEDAFSILERYKVLGVAGISGIGKTALIYYMAAALISKGKRALVIRPVPGLETPSPWPVAVVMPGGDGRAGETVFVPVLEVPSHVERDLRTKKDPLSPTILAVVDTLAKWDKIEEFLREKERWKNRDGVIEAAFNFLEFQEEVIDLLSRNEGAVGEALSSFLPKIEAALSSMTITFPSAASLAVLSATGLRAILAWRTKRRISKVVERLDDVYLFVDDPSCFTGEGAILLLSALREAFKGQAPGGLVFVVRVDTFTGEDYLEFCENPVKHAKESIDISKLGLPLPSWAGDVLVLLPAPDIKTFKALVKANANLLPEAIRERLDEPGFLEDLYEATGGLPAIAISALMVGLDPGEVRAGRRAEYATFNVVDKLIQEAKRAPDGSYEARKKREEALRAVKNALSAIYSSVLAIYGALRRENVGYIAFLVQPEGLALEELEAFYAQEPFARLKVEVGGGRGATDIITSPRIHLQREQENWDGARDIYALGEPAKHLAPLVDELATRGLRKGPPRGLIEPGVRLDVLGEEVAEARLALLKAMRAEVQKAGRSTGRMVRAALHHLKWLYDVGLHSIRPELADELALQALAWGRLALSEWPCVGVDFIPVALSLIEASSWGDEVLLYATPFMSELADGLKKFIGLRDLEDRLKELEDLLKELECRRPSPAALIWLPCVWADVARAWDALAKRAKASKAFAKAREILQQLYGEAKDMAHVLAASPLAEYLLTHNLPKEATRVLSLAREAISRLDKALERPVLSDVLKDAFRSLGGKAEEKLRHQLDSEGASITFAEGRLRLDAGDLRKASRAFKDAWARFVKLKDLENALVAWSLYVRAYVIEEGLSARPSDLEGREMTCLEHFRRMWFQAKKLWKEEALTPETYYTAYMQTLIAELASPGQEGRPLALDMMPLSGVPIRSEAWATFTGTYCVLLKLLHGLEPSEEMFRGALRAMRTQAEELKTRLEQGLPLSSMQRLSAILLALLEDRFDEAVSRAREASKRYSPLLNELFSELAEAVKAYSAIRNDERARVSLARALLKLFYYHI